MVSRFRAALISALLMFALVGCSAPSHAAINHGLAKPTGAAVPRKPPAKPPKPGGRGPAGSLTTTGSKGVALTFDDGPDPRSTPRLLSLLKKYGVKATFCVVGTRARAHPALIRRIIAEGHTICNHSWQHLLNLGASTHSSAYILHDLRATNNAILAAAPKAKIKYFRAPGGNYNVRLVELAETLGMTPIYWSVDPQDWNAHKYGHGAPMVRHIIAAVKHYTRPGSIVLSHDINKPDTLTAYQTLVPWLKARFTLIKLRT